MNEQGKVHGSTDETKKPYLLTTGIWTTSGPSSTNAVGLDNSRD